MRIYTGGTFDLFHSGHVSLLRRLHFLGAQTNEVTVSLNTDEFIEEYKGRSPVTSYEERRTILLACRYVVNVIPNVGGADSKKTIDRMGELPHIVGIGSDWHHPKDYMLQMGFTWEWLADRNITLAYIPRVLAISTTDIKGRI